MSYNGSFKTPGGKLVNVGFDVENGKLRNVQVHGDFFLHPEDVLPLIAQSLEGVEVDATQEETTEKIRRSIPAGTEWLGASPEALGTAVERAKESISSGSMGGGRGFE